jgi:hypothetical protein
LKEVGVEPHIADDLRKGTLYVICSEPLMMKLVTELVDRIGSAVLVTPVKMPMPTEDRLRVMLNRLTGAAPAPQGLVP